MTDQEREQRIRALMAEAGMTYDEARFALAVDAGEIAGDAIEVERPEDADEISRSGG